MRAEFYRPDDPEKVVATARWDGRRAQIESDDDAARASVRKILRPTPVVVDDGSLRPLGSSGESVVQPGTLEWFRAAAQARAAPEGLRARLVPEALAHTGWDPASAYRTFRQVVADLESPATHGSEPQAESARPL
ncbi:MAG TPA: hypothetical protein VGB19_15490 [Actinomycetota bacterium]